jgi:signal transduction histidine kinase
VLRRLSIRLRLTLLFALVMAVVLAAVGVFLYVRLDGTLDDSSEAEALETLLTALLIGGPIVLVLASLAAYRLAAAALRPVESMRREAEAISALEPDRRLDVPATADEIGRLARTLNEMLDRLETALERERRFVADASHELRTPLAALRTELELALRRERTPAELEQALASAAEETERLSQLAEDLLVLARSNGGVLPVRREQIDAEDLLAGVGERYTSRAVRAGRSLALSAPAGLIVTGDRLRLEQALGNLVENALRHGRGGIEVRAVPADGSVELHVTDEGDGLDPDEAFRPFARGDDADPAGAGLGLAIVDVIARAHGGSAHAAAADVWVSLPK